MIPLPPRVTGPGAFSKIDMPFTKVKDKGKQRAAFARWRRGAGDLTEQLILTSQIILQTLGAHLAEVGPDDGVGRLASTCHAWHGELHDACEVRRVACAERAAHRARTHWPSGLVHYALCILTDVGTSRERTELHAIEAVDMTVGHFLRYNGKLHVWMRTLHERRGVCICHCELVGKPECEHCRVHGGAGQAHVVLRKVAFVRETPSSHKRVSVRNSR